MSERVSDCDALLIALQAKHGDWVPHTELYEMRLMVHSRIADLRRRGHRIECRKFAARDYRYRLVQGEGRS